MAYTPTISHYYRIRSKFHAMYIEGSWETKNEAIAALAQMDLYLPSSYYIDRVTELSNPLMQQINRRVKSDGSLFTFEEIQQWASDVERHYGMTLEEFVSAEFGDNYGTAWAAYTEAMEAGK